MKIYSVTPNNLYIKPSNTNISFKGDENSIQATNPDVPQFEQNLAKLKPSKIRNLVGKLVSFFTKDSNESGIYTQQGLEEYVSQRVFLI